MVFFVDKCDWPSCGAGISICMDVLPVLTPHARDRLCFVLHVADVVIEQRLIVARLLCSQFEFIASGTVLGLWLCRGRLLGCRLQWFLLGKGLLLLGVARATSYTSFFLLVPRRWICRWATDGWIVFVSEFCDVCTKGNEIFTGRRGMGAVGEGEMILAEK